MTATEDDILSCRARSKPVQARRGADRRGRVPPDDADRHHQMLVAPVQLVALGTSTPLVGSYEWFFKEVVALSPPMFGLPAAHYELAVGCCC